MFRKRYHKQIPELNTTSTADISFMLLIFFLVTSSMDTEKGLMRQLAPPPIENQQPQDVNKDLVVRVELDAHDQLTCDGKSATLDELAQAVTAMAQVNRTGHVISIQADLNQVQNRYNRVEKPKSEYKSHHRVALTVDEQKKLVDYLNNVSYKECRHKYILLLLLSTGMRIGEALVLDYDKDIDLENRKIYIRRTQTKDNNGKAIIGNTTKTNTGQRTLNMNNIIYQIIQGALEHKIDNKEHLLFCKEDRTMYVENSINSSLKRIALDLNIGIYEEENTKGKLVKKTDIHTHMLRGTFATRCAEAKIAPAVLKKILGHTDITVTMKYYVDVDVEFEKTESKNVEDYLIDKEIFNIDSDYNLDYI